MFALRWGEVEGTPEHVIVHSELATVLLAKLTFSVYLMAYTRGWCLMLKPAPASHSDQFQSRNIEIYAVLYQLTFRPIFVKLKKSPLRTDKIDWTDNDWQHRGFYSKSQAEQSQSSLAISTEPASYYDVPSNPSKPSNICCEASFVLTAYSQVCDIFSIVIAV